ncbi:MAG: hypothetical protein D6685_01785 [Bacteroidetes bacterium]|nr:MAG: hypothetical protein D6685_01785 [Bacteroidota bacterium]
MLVAARGGPASETSSRPPAAHPESCIQVDGMKTPCVYVLLLACLMGLAAVEPVQAQQSGKRGSLPRTDPSYKTLIHRARTEGSVPVIVELNLGGSAARTMAEVADGASAPAPAGVSAPAPADSPPAIARVQARVLAGLPRSAAAPMRPATAYRHLPFLALDADLETLEWLMGSPEVLRIQEDRPVPPLISSTVELVGAEEAWARGYSGQGQTIAIIDSGVDPTHHTLAGKIVAEACFSTSSYVSTTLCPDGTDEQIGPGAGVHCDPAIPGCGHGTQVASVAAGHDETYAGVARDASILSIQVFSRFDSESYCGAGKAPCVLSWTSDQLAALDHVYGLASDPDGPLSIAAVNLSLGGWKYTDQDLCDAHNAPMKAYVDSLRSVNVAVVAAAGNNGYADGLVSPACISSIVSVGASTTYDEVSSFSNSAPFLDLLAPGQAVEAAKAGGGYGAASGTSLAAPHVAGAWAVLRSRAPSATVDEIEAALRITGRPIVDARNGLEKPRLQVDQALVAGALPVELTAFEGRVEGQTVRLIWSTASETNNAGFEVEQALVTAAGPGAWRQIGYVAGAGTTDTPQTYTYPVAAVEPGVYRYRLKQVDYDGTFAYSPEVEVQIQPAGAHYLSPAHPNPFHARAAFTLTLTRPQQVTVAVYDALGRRVTVLQDGYLEAGVPHSFTLDGTGWGSGLYLYEAVGETFRESRTVLHAR